MENKQLVGLMTAILLTNHITDGEANSYLIEQAVNTAIQITEEVDEQYGED